MYFRLAARMLGNLDSRVLWKTAINAGLRGAWSFVKFKQRLKRGEFFPPILFISIVNSCNLRCQGCWVDVSAKQQIIDAPAMHRLIREAKAAGNSIFGILGGEPFMHPELLEILAKHPDCFFQVFTNGHFITPEVAQRLRRMGNVTPLISIEGTEIISDVRRGRPEVYSKSMQGLQNCLKEHLFTGVCTSLCQTNYDDLLQEKWVDRLIEMGVMYTWFHVFRPVGPLPNPELCLTPDQQRRARQFVVEMRVKKPIIIVDAYYDADGRAICPAVAGISHHISPWGDIEPCPIIQFAKESIHDPRPIDRTFAGSEYLKDFRELTAGATRGCVVLERPDLLKDLVEKHGAKDTTARKAAMAELEAMLARPSQDDPEHQIPEKSWAYWLAKKFCYHDFGAYTKSGLVARRKVSTVSSSA